MPLLVLHPALGPPQTKPPCEDPASVRHLAGHRTARHGWARHPAGAPGTRPTTPPTPPADYSFFSPLLAIVLELGAPQTKPQCEKQASVRHLAGQGTGLHGWARHRGGVCRTPSAPPPASRAGWKPTVPVRSCPAHQAADWHGQTGHRAGATVLRRRLHLPHAPAGSRRSQLPAESGEPQEGLHPPTTLAARLFPLSSCSRLSTVGTSTQSLRQDMPVRIDTPGKQRQV